MRVLYPLRYYPTVSETFVYREIEGLVALGHEVVVAALGDRPDGAIDTELPGVPVLRVPRRPLVGRLSPRSPGQRWLVGHQRSKDADRLPWLAAHARRFDHLHVHFGGEAAELAHALHRDLGVPYSVTVHGTDVVRPRPSLREVLRAAAYVLAVSDLLRRALAEQWGIAAHLVHCGPDLARFAPVPLPAGPLRAIAIGRNVEKKGFDTLLAVWPELSPATLVLVSDWRGPVPAGVSLTGLLGSRAVRERLAAANLLVAPSRVAADGDTEGIPLVLMEALATGRPVVTTSVGGIPELVDASVGWLVPPADERALVGALRSASDPEERARRGAAGPQRLRERGFTAADQTAGLAAALALTGAR